MAVKGDNNVKKRNKKLNSQKNNSPFRSCISKIKNAIFYNAEYLDVVMPMYI